MTRRRYLAESQGLSVMSKRRSFQYFKIEYFHHLDFKNCDLINFEKNGNHHCTLT
jgi:hypothetical protein